MKAARTMNAKIGSSLATVVTALSTAAWCTPRASTAKITQVSTVTALAETQRLSAENSGT